MSQIRPDVRIQMASDEAPPQVILPRKWPPVMFKPLVLLILLVVGGAILTLRTSNYLTPQLLQHCSTTISTVNSVSTLETPGSIARLFNGGFPLRHNYTDGELLWLSSLQFQRPPVQTTTTKKIAFMFMTKGPLPLAPLWELYFRGNEHLYNIYVHATPGFNLDVPPTSVFYQRQIPSQAIQWGEITMCDAERRLLANALLDHSNERFILVSESCAPLYNLTTFYNYVINSRHSFLSVFDDPGPFGRGRYSPSMQPEVTLEQWKKGSQWFEVSRKVALYIVSDTRYYPKFREFCRPACYVDEHYFPTMLTIELGSELANRSLTAVDWSRGGSHPATFSEPDINPEFLQRFRNDRNCSYNGEFGNICFFFARKFSPNTLVPLTKLLRDDFGRESS